MSRLIFLLSLFIYTINVSAQSFERLISMPNDARGMAIIEYDSAYCFIVNEELSEFMAFEEKASVFRMDKNGMITDSLFIPDSIYWMRPSNLIPVNGGLFISGPAMHKQTLARGSWIAVVKQDFSLEYLKFIPGNEPVMDFEFYANDTILGIQDKTLIIINASDGTWTYGAYLGDNDRKLVCLPQNPPLLFSIGPLSTKLCISKIDSSLQSVSDTAILEHLPYAFEYSSLVINDSVFYVSASKVKFPGVYMEYALTKVNANLSLQSQTLLSTSYNNGSIEAYVNALALHKDSTALFFGGTFDWDRHSLSHFTQAPYRFQLHKVDVDDTPVWHKIFRYNDGEPVNYSMYNLAGTSDGGCIMIGSRWDYTNPEIMKRDVYILKVDSLGNYTPSVFYSVDGQNQENVLLYPNPAGDAVTITVPEALSGSDINLYDLSGRKVLSQGVVSTRASIDLTGLARGVYMVQVGGTRGQKLIVR